MLMQMPCLLKERRVSEVKIGEKEYSETLVMDSENNLLVSITDEDIIVEKDCKFVCVPLKDN